MILTVQKPIFAESASKLVNSAGNYSSTILIKKDHWVVDAKSLLGVLALALQPGEQVEINAEGDAEEFITEIVNSGLFSK
ncbi:MAG: HPr family phosphocarrier protein [Bacillus sp. (in: Bacteria)]|nr:HPr family phosphocarrier protein [Bacillus sp. (in: firmicutes)]